MGRFMDQGWSWQEAKPVVDYMLEHHEKELSDQGQELVELRQMQMQTLELVQGFDSKLDRMEQKIDTVNAKVEEVDRTIFSWRTRAAASVTAVGIAGGATGHYLSSIWTYIKSWFHG